MALPRVDVPKCARPAEMRVDVGWLPRDEIGVPPWAAAASIYGLRSRVVGRSYQGG